MCIRDSGHTDHILALKEVKEYFNVPVIISKIDEMCIRDSLIRKPRYNMIT